MIKKQVYIDTSRLEAIHKTMSPEDFINQKFDIDTNTRTKNVLIVFSTPRSGSTMLCDLLFQNNACLAHEYIQQFEYLPLLSERWNCIHNNILDKQLFVDKLLKYRTFKNGWLGINLHGEHIPNFIKLEECFSDVQFHYVHLIRGDIIAQAISYQIAIQTGKWSSNFNEIATPSYDYEAILNKLNRINEQNTLIQAYIKSRELVCNTIYYEDFVKDPFLKLKNFPCINDETTLKTVSETKKQSSNTNKEWAKQFSNEFINHQYLPKQRERKGILSWLKKS